MYYLSFSQKLRGGGVKDILLAGIKFLEPLQAGNRPSRRKGGIGNERQGKGPAEGKGTGCGYDTGGKGIPAPL